MSIAITGAGHIGTHLAQQFTRKGHQVTLAFSGDERHFHTLASSLVFVEDRTAQGIPGAAEISARLRRVASLATMAWVTLESANPWLAVIRVFRTPDGEHRSIAPGNHRFRRRS